MTSAIIQTGGKQYRVTAGQLVKIEKINAEVGEVVTFDQVLAVIDGEEVTLGTANGIVVSGEVIEQGKGKKIRVFTYKSKKRQRRTLGHRQLVTIVRIDSIGANAAPKAAAAAPKRIAKVKPAIPAA